MRGAGVLPLASKTNMAVNNNQSWSTLGLAGHAKRAHNRVQVIRVANTQHIPSIPQIASAWIIAVRKIRLAFNGDVVVVVNPNQIIQLQMASDTSSLATYAFHHATVATNRVGAKIKNLKAWSIECRGQPFLRHRHSNRIRQALSKRTRGCFQTTCPTMLRMSWAQTIELSKRLDGLNGNRGLARQLAALVHFLRARQMQQTVNQHARMSIAQHKSIAIWPQRIGGIKL